MVGFPAWTVLLSGPMNKAMSCQALVVQISFVWLQWGRDHFWTSFESTWDQFEMRKNSSVLPCVSEALLCQTPVRQKPHIRLHWYRDPLLDYNIEEFFCQTPVTINRLSGSRNSGFFGRVPIIKGFFWTPLVKGSFVRLQLQSIPLSISSSKGFLCQTPVIKNLFVGLR